MASNQSAIITGGASGMGLAVAKALAERGGWNLHLLDLNAERGEAATKEVSNATFHKTNVTDYESLAKVFQSVFESDGRLDFVFANAGIVERYSFYDEHPAGQPPPPPDLSVVDINLKSVINTCWLAQHYFRQSKTGAEKNIVMTASTGGLYRCQASPSYAAAKHGVVGLMRSIAPHFYEYDGIRVNAICPGSVRTNLLESSAWDSFGTELEFVPIETIASTVLMLIDGYDVGGKNITDSRPLVSTSWESKDAKLNGQSVELSGSNHYYRQQVDFSDQNMEKCMGMTDKTNF